MTVCKGLVLHGVPSCYTVMLHWGEKTRRGKRGRKRRGERKGGMVLW